MMVWHGIVKGGIYMAKATKHNAVNPELEAEIAEWGDYLMADLRERAGGEKWL